MSDFIIASCHQIKTKGKIEDFKRQRLRCHNMSNLTSQL